MDVRVYYHDTDCGGVVYYANYLKYMEQARTEFLEGRGLVVSELMRQGVFFAVRSCRIDYRRPARYGDELSCDARLLRLGGAQLVFEQAVLMKSDSAVVAEAEVSLVCLNQDFRPVALPEAVRGRLA